MYSVLTEKLMDYHLISLFPQTTMKDSHLKLTEKKYNLLNHQDIERLFHTIAINIDFNKWNTNLRGSMFW